MTKVRYIKRLDKPEQWSGDPGHEDDLPDRVARRLVVEGFVKVIGDEGEQESEGSDSSG